MNPIPDFRLFFEAAPGANIVVANDPSYTILAVSNAYLKASMTVREDIVGRGLFEVFSQDHKTSGNVLTAFQRIRKTQLPEQLEIQQYDIKIPGTDKVEERYWSPKIFPLLDESGNVTSFMCEVTDVTETEVLKRHERVLDNERTNFRKLFMQTPEMVVIMRGPQHIFEFVNEAHIRVLGFDATGMTIREAQPESVEVHGILDSVYRTGRTAELHEIPITVTDRLRYFNLTYSAGRDEAGHVTGIMVLGIEVTEQVMARENLKKAIRTRDEFLSLASHELKTPLTSMKIQVQLFTKTATDEKLKPMIGVMERGIERLVRLVDDMLDISRIQIGKLAYNKEILPLDAFLKDIIERYHPELQKAGIDLSTNFAPGVQTLFDPFRIEQVVTNLLTNVVRYAPKAPMHISMETKDGHAVIIFQDHGPGIKRDDRKRVFDRFERLVPGNEVSGMGLGLYICKEIVEGHGGKILVEENERPGACFVIQLPI